MTNRIDNWNYYWQIGYKAVKELETEEGILASAANELYGAVFGRDSLITSLKLLKVYEETKVTDFLTITRKVLLTLASLQGKEINIESGEEPGKCIHEYRPTGHEHLTKSSAKPWYLYPDQVMRSYDTVDATALFLIASYRYFQISKDQDFLTKIEANIIAAINWTFLYGDKNKDGFIDYNLNPKRKFGGLLNQNWMDSTESTFHEDGSVVSYPLAPVEVQAYTYLALKLWFRHFQSRKPKLAEKLFARAYQLKKSFNETFVTEDENGRTFIASGIDNQGKLLTSVRSSMGHALWASLNLNDDQELSSIIESETIPKIVERLLQPDIFEPEAGIRTLSKNSLRFSPNSYHNGSIWPHDNSMIAEGLENFGFTNEAWQVRKAFLKAISHFDNPIELFVYDQTYTDYFSPNGQTSCKTQAWSAAAILSAVSQEFKAENSKLSKKLTNKWLKQVFLVNLLSEKIAVRINFYPRELLKNIRYRKAFEIIEKLRERKLKV